jgi:transcriptional regulator with XRE-family HTH domain
MQSTVNERLKILMEDLGMNPNSLSRTLGISPSTLRNYTDRDSKPGYEVLEKLYHSFKHINLYWLFGEPGKPLFAADESIANYQASEKNSGNIIGTNNGTATVNQLADCEKDLRNAREKIALLSSQLEVQTKYIKLLEAQQPK